MTGKLPIVRKSVHQRSEITDSNSKKRKTGKIFLALMKLLEEGEKRERFATIHKGASCG